MGESQGNPQVLSYATPRHDRQRNVPAILSIVAGVLIYASAVVCLHFMLWPRSSEWLVVPFALACLAIISGIGGLFMSRRRRSGLCWSMNGILCGVLWLMVFAPNQNRGYILDNRTLCGILDNRTLCGSHLRQLGQAMLLYSNENKGQYPTRWEDVLITQGIGPEAFCCPSTDATRAPGTTPQEQAAHLRATSPTGQLLHLSFIYVGQGFTAATVPPDAILAYEPLSNHGNEGANVLFGDGHIEFLPKKKVRRMIQELTAGHNPPRPEKFKR